MVLSSLYLHPRPTLQLYHCAPQQGNWRMKNSSRLLLCKDGEQIQSVSVGDEEECWWSRRRALLFEAVLACVSSPAIALASEKGNVLQTFRVYTDETNKFKITIPEDWLVGTGEGGARSVTAFYPPESSSSNVSIIITGLGADFTRLESFGKVDAFAENLVGGLDRSWQRPPGVAAKLVDSKAANGLYYIEYTMKNPGESRRNLLTVLGISKSKDGYYNRLYTLTGQFVDEEEEKFADKIRKAVSSFRLT